MQSHRSITNAQEPIPPIDFEAVFNALPGMCAILSGSEYRIVAVSDSLCAAMYQTREKLVGKIITDVLSERPSAHLGAGTNTLRESLDKVKMTKQPCSLSVVRYDIARPGREGDGTDESWWRFSDSPVLDERGEVIYIVHAAEEVTRVLEALEGLEVAAKRRADGT